ncbi:Double-strand break repair protein MRE11 [Vitis vinifera]|uniref:Double-strand break repair protein MRE11 n=1 Tax=Vitis vinifera TaxID=29760 RepID=A0A438FK20_VITVI|nr:Double-strand break repair protein MRE11 [Vitis vinifera]
MNCGSFQPYHFHSYTPPYHSVESRNSRQGAAGLCQYKETPQFMSGAQSLENITSKATAETRSAVSFSDDEDLSQLSGSKSTTRGRSSSSATFKSSHNASEHGKVEGNVILCIGEIGIGISIFNFAPKKLNQMFFLSLIEHTLQLRPHLLDLPLNEAVKGEFESLFLNKILPVNDVDLALHNFVYKDDKMSFYSCVQYNLEETHERVKERSVHSKETPQFMSGAQSLENITSKGTAETGSAVSFSDDEDLSRLSGSKSTTRGRSSSSATFKSSHDASEHGKGETCT